MLFPGQEQSNTDGTDAACQFSQDHGPQKLRSEAGGEAKMVAENEGGGYGKGDVHHLAPLIHVLHHIKEIPLYSWLAENSSMNSNFVRGFILNLLKQSYGFFPSVFWYGE